MLRSFYILICLLLSLNFWSLSFLSNYLNNDISFFIIMLWSLVPYFIYNPLESLVKLNSFKNLKYLYLIWLGIFISVFSAYFFWGQQIHITLIAQRSLYSFLLLPALLYIAPSEKEIFKALEWISIGTMFVWVLSIFAPQLISSISEDVIEMSENRDSSDIGFYVGGIHFVVLYFYFLVQKYIINFKLSTFLKAVGIFSFIFLYQNRSLLLGAVLVYIYSLIKFKSKFKLGLLFIQIILIVVGVIITKDIWIALIEESQSQLIDQDYNRWKALSYYFFEYSPNWFCYIFGNGMPSVGNSILGNLYLSNMENGIYTSDLGMIGMWTMYGVIPLITIYSILINSIIRKEFPLYLKFISFHILLVPTIFQFGRNPGIFFFVLIIYLFILSKELKKLNNILCLQ